MPGHGRALVGGDRWRGRLAIPLRGIAGAGSFASPPGADDERAEYTDDESDAEEAAQIAVLDAAAETDAAGDAKAEAIRREEQALLDRMEEVASAARGLPDAKTRRLIDWIRDNLCPELPRRGKRSRGGGATPARDASPARKAPTRSLPVAALAEDAGESTPRNRQTTAPAVAARWNDRRVLIFTENVVGTKRYLREMLEQAIAGTDLAEERIETIDGQTVGTKRKEIQRRFNADPARDPLRILLATDAAREGLNFQAHCTDLFHFDLPWNPGRIEQRNGRIDRKLQPAPRVRCHYFVLPQRAEDHVLEVLVRKTETIKRELGSLSRVIDDDVERRLRGGIRHRDAKHLAREIEAADLDREKKRVAAEELEAARERREDLKAQIERCRALLERSRRWVHFSPEPFRDAMSCSLELLGAAPLQEGRGEDGQPIWTFPPDGTADASGQRGSGRGTGLFHASWAATLDTLRAPRKTRRKLAEWRREAPIRPVVFEDAGVLSDDTVHLHLEQRLAQRLLARFRTQGFVHHDLSRACLVQAADSIPRVVLLGRLCLFGRRAERLHEVLVPVAARWIEPSRRAEPLKGVCGGGRSENAGTTGGRLAGCPRPRRDDPPPAPRNRCPDVEDLLPQLEVRAELVARRAADRLRERGEGEERQLRETLEGQRRRVETELRKHEGGGVQLAIEFSEEEKRQRQADVASWRTRLAQFDRDLDTSRPAFGSSTRCGPSAWNRSGWSISGRTRGDGDAQEALAVSGLSSVLSYHCLRQVTRMLTNHRQFREITLRDFRCFRERQTVPLAPLTLLVGENSTGKTSFPRGGAGGVGCRPRERRAGLSQGSV